MDSKTEDILRNADLLDFVQAFKDQEITFESLQELTVKDLLPIFNNKIGVAGKFMTHLKKVSSEPADQDAAPNANQNGEILEERVEEIPRKRARSQSPTSDEEVDDVLTTEQVASIDAAADEHAKVIEGFLKHNIIGRGLLNLSKKRNVLDKKDKGKLAHEVIVGELNGNPKKEIDEKRFRELISGICKLFPGELEALYYIPRKPAKKRRGPENKLTVVVPAVAPKGILYDKYHNLLKFLRSAGLRPSNRSYVGEEETDDWLTDPAADTIKEQLNWLEKFSTLNQETATEYWLKTQEHRLSELRKKTKFSRQELDKYWKRFDCMAQDWGLQLLARDFEFLYADTYSPLIRNWSSIHSKLLKLAGKSVEDIAADSYAETLGLIPSFFTQPQMSGKKPKKSTQNPNPKQPFWKPNRQESVKGFFYAAEDQRSLSDHVDRVQTLLSAIGKGLQPFPFLLEDVKTSYIWINGEQFPLESPLAALDLCFKIYHALHTEYPYQSSYSWLFLQQAIYGIKTEWDYDAPGVIAKVNAYSKLT